MITLNPCSARSLPISKPLSGKMYGLMQVRTAEAVVSSAKHLPAKEKMRKWYQKTSQGQNSAAQSNYSGSVKLCSEVTHKCYQQQVTCKENLNHNLQTKASQHLSRCKTTWSLFCKLNFCFFSCLAKSMTRQELPTWCSNSLLCMIFFWKSYITRKEHENKRQNGKQITVRFLSAPLYRRNFPLLCIEIRPRDCRIPPLLGSYSPRIPYFVMCRETWKCIS